jgi:hypothetical protein
MSSDDVKVFNSLINPKYSGYKDDEKIDIKRFVSDSKYADSKIRTYNILRATYNPLWVLKTVPHYKGYLETLYNAYESIRNLSAKFRYISDNKKRYEHKYSIHD